MTGTVLRNRVLGVVFVCLLLTGGWLTYAVFNKTFVDVVHVHVTATRAGLQLPEHADVKMRGVIVGEVRSMASDGDGARLDLALSPGEVGYSWRNSLYFLVRTGHNSRLVDCW